MKQNPEEIKNEIIEYCRFLIKKIRIDYLLQFDVYQNEFLEFLFLSCLNQYEKEGSYELSDESISILFSVKKQNEVYMNKIKEKKLTIIGIETNDNLIIEENEINIGTKA